MTNSFAFEVKVILGLESTLNYFTGYVGSGWVAGWWVAGKCETITNSASAEAEVEAWAELGNTLLGGWVVGLVAGWVAGNRETITNSASAEA